MNAPPKKLFVSAKDAEPAAAPPPVKKPPVDELIEMEPLPAFATLMSTLLPDPPVRADESWNRPPLPLGAVGVPPFADVDAVPKSIPVRPSAKTLDEP